MPLRSPFTTATQLSGQSPYYPALTGLRAVAALLVFITHSNSFDPHLSSEEWLYAFVHQGHFGVSIFFVLSGFLIATRYHGRVKPTWPWVRQYMQNRVARIYPLYLLLTIATFVVGTLDPAYDYSAKWQYQSLLNKAFTVFLNLTFLRGYFEYYCWTGVSQGWSLAVEETFYVIAPIVLWTVAGKAQRLLWWTAGLLATGVALGHFFFPFTPPLYGLFASKQFMLEWTFFGRAFEFTSGMALALLMARQGAGDKKGAAATCGGIAWIIGCALFIATMEQLHAPLSPGHLKVLTLNFLLPPGVCLLLYGILRERTGFRWVLETKTFDLLGKSSYAFYLIHLGILSVALKTLGTPVWVNLLVSMLLSIALYKLVEEPLHKRIKAWRFGRSRRPRAPAAVAVGNDR